MRSIFVLMVTAAVSVGVVAESQQPPPKESLAFLGDLEGKRPSEARVFANPALKARLSTLLGPEAALVPDRFQVDSPIQKSAEIVAFSGNKQHQGGSDDALIVVNTKTNDLWVWLRINGQLRHYGPDREPQGLPADAAAVLKNMRGK